MGRVSYFLIYMVYVVSVGGGFGVLGGVIYGCYVMVKKSVVSGLLIIGASAAGGLLATIVTLALIAVAAFLTDGANGPSDGG